MRLYVILKELINPVGLHELTINIGYYCHGYDTQLQNHIELW